MKKFALQWLCLLCMLFILHLPCRAQVALVTIESDFSRLGFEAKWRVSLHQWQVRNRILTY